MYGGWRRLVFIGIPILVIVAVLLPDFRCRWGCRVTADPADWHQQLSFLFSFPDQHPPTSLNVYECVTLDKPDEPLQAILGCRFSIDPRDFSKLLRGRDFEHRSLSSNKAPLKVPVLEPALMAAEVYFSSPPQDWNNEGVTIYTNTAHSEVAAYSSSTYVN